MPTPSLPDLPAPPSAADYEEWLQSEPAPEDLYLLTNPRVRFEPRATDVLVAAPGGAPTAVPGVDPASLRRFFELTDGERSLGVLRAGAGLSAEESELLLAACFGKTLFAPRAVAELESALPSAELVRFPGSPYEVNRNYWQNMGAVRARAGGLFDVAGRPLDALVVLGRLHALALLGEDGRTYYRPASPIAKKGIAPGTLWQTSGARVNASEVGGSAYWTLLAQSADDLGALGSEREHVDEGGLAWGNLVSTEGADGTSTTWFCPPRPMTRAHVESLFRSLGEARLVDVEGAHEKALTALAAFHQRFVKLHPFRAGNQALAMNLVNAVLRGLTGAGIPHLLLDQLALRFDARAYATLFMRASSAWSVGAAPLERYRALTQMKQRYFSLVESLAQAPDSDAARRIVDGAPDAARLALLSD